MVDFINLIKDKEANFDKLLEFGFKQNDKHYIYNKLVGDGMVKIIIHITTDGLAGTKVIDNETKEKYIPFYNVNGNGEFVRSIRCEYDRLIMELIDTCYRDINKLPGQTNTGDMMLFSSQMRALEAELLKLNEVETNNGVLSEFEEERKNQIENILNRAEVALNPSSYETITYGTTFSASIDGRPARKFTLVYANTEVLKGLDGTTFLAQDTVFGVAVFGKADKEIFSFLNQRGIESECVITEIHETLEEENVYNHGCKVR